MRVSDTVAVVSGGASGLGEAVVRMIVGNGGKAAILDLNEDRGTALVRELGPAAVFHRVDVTDEDAVAAGDEAPFFDFGRMPSDWTMPTPRPLGDWV